MKNKYFRFINCNKCGGSLGTLVKKGDVYEHMREQDCKRQREAVASKANILAQTKPVKEEK